METRGVRIVEGSAMLDDARLERLGNMFTANNIYERFGVTFEDYVKYVATGMCHYYFFCRGADKC